MGDPVEYELAFRKLCLAKELTSLEKDRSRKQKKTAALKELWAAFQEAFPAVPDGVRHDTITLPVLVELALSNPFEPYSLLCSADCMRNALISTASSVGRKREEVYLVETYRKRAVRAHKQFPWLKMLGLGLGGLTLGSLVAPGIGSWIGAASGLHGAAAGAYGLAFLGGGSIASGGLGMAGGTWLVGSLTAAGSATTGALLHRLDANVLVLECVKLQVLYLLGEVPPEALTLQLERLANELRDDLGRETLLNEKDAPRLVDLRSKIRTLNATTHWVKGLSTAV